MWSPNMRSNLIQVLQIQKTSCNSWGWVSQLPTEKVILQFQLNYDDKSNNFSYFLQIQHMSTKATSDNLSKYLAIGGALGLAYLAINYLTNPSQKSSSKTIPIETVKNILKEVKYQVYASCISYSEGVEKKLKAYPKKDVEIYLRTELAKAYEAKEDLILVKYQVSKDELSLALNAYHKDKQIKRDTEEIFKVLEETVRGEINLSVPEPATKLYNAKDLVRIYRQMCVDIGVAVWQKLLECIKNNPAFNAKDDAHFRKAMRELGIYEFKVKYLANHGFKPEWGCPNFIFLKLLEGTKKNDLEVRTECFYIEKGYEEIITKISAHPEDYNKVFIDRIMEDTINKLKNPVKVQVQPNPVVNQAPKQQAVQQQASRPVVQPVQPVQPSKPVFAAPPMVEEDEFDMEKLMMEELLSRSQQIPKEQAVKKVEAPVAVEAKPEPVSQGIDVKLYVENKPEPEVQEGVHEKPRVVQLGIFLDQPSIQVQQQPVSVIEQAPVIVDEPAVVPKAEEEAVIENLPKEATHSVEFVIPQEEQSIHHVEAPVQISEEPAVEQPVVEEPVVEEPVVEQEPVVEEPVVEEPAVEQPVVEEPAVEQPVVEEPVVEQPVQAESQVQESEVIHNVEAMQEVVQPPAEIVVEQQVLPEQPVEQPAEQPVEQPVEQAVEQPQQAQQIPEQVEEQEYVREN